ncbi:hypothetical protein WICPIJ_008199 [Wickerhamomyces pijperi]|uniref:V-type proton ATPase subunit a n=1 Tax=Wickerhamomyces pijperi TaxID=599730 RepID=A0A9P8TIB7_WICPI|nr:hypothetical protein WICPIJ_008199 [Wickerhamomyces pijperi]
MTLIELFIPIEISRDTVYDLGNVGNIQFRDLNSKVNAFQRSFVKEIKRLDNVQRQYRFFKNEIEDREIEIFENPDFDVSQEEISASGIDELVEEGQLLEDRLKQLLESTDTLEIRKKDLLQLRHTLIESNDIFQKKSPDAVASAHDLIVDEASLNKSFVTGVIPRTKSIILEKILWRVLRGNLFFERREIEEPIYDAKTKKTIAKDYFIVFSHGYQIIERIKKISESLDAELYDVDSDNDGRYAVLTETNRNLADLNTVLDSTVKTLESELTIIADSLFKWYSLIQREKSVYEILNFFDYDVNRKTLIGEGWIPTAEIEGVKNILLNNSQGLQSVLNVLETTRTPPTYHKTNKFTDAFQNLCDAYGVAQYKEVNAGLPTIVTFPFMFAIMFGDLGHGFILTCAAASLVYFEKSIARIKRDEIFDMAFSGRYILLLMGIFSMVTGFMYNDLFSKSMTIFESAWEWPEHEVGETIFAVKKDFTYAIGLDPAWHGTENALLFTNSYKMKLSILMGFIHMSYSYMFSLVNYVHFKSMIDIIGNFIPGLLFMQAIFGYLSICIVYKWSINWIEIGKPAPGLLNMLISMFLSPGTVADPLYPHQAQVQVFLLTIALICVPCLLLIKPMYYKRKLDKEAEYKQLHGSEEAALESAHGNGGDDDDEEGHGEEFGDIMIHQVIHTIEFCLNTVSHTASYLRLWALSLAHAQLSTVLWTMTIQGAFGATGVVGVISTVFLFGMWFVLTVIILVIMEGTSAMLHSLRLHWVESMSKFFVGGGKLYEPFNFKGLLTEFESIA